MRCGNCGRVRGGHRGACECVPAWVWCDPEVVAAVHERDAQWVIQFLGLRVEGLSQEALAGMCGVAQSTINRAEAEKGLTDRRKAYEALQGLGAPLEEPVTASASSEPPRSHHRIPQVGPILNLNELTRTLIGHATPSPGHLETSSLTRLSQEVRRIKAAYQACRYTETASRLPRVLRHLDQEPSVLGEEAHNRWLQVRADAYHVTASVLLKCDEQGLAWLAADRSHQAAQASQDPVLVGSSARVYVRALMRERHYRTATDSAVSTAERLNHPTSSSTASAVSVYGSLMLIGAVAAARHEDRARALSLLDEAAQTASRLGGDHNHRWTAFGPTNVLLHRVSTAVELGDAGQAVHQARQIDPARVPLMERKVVLHLDTARAYTQWGKLREAHTALTTAERLAPEELKERPMVHRLVDELRTRSTGHLKRDFVQLADRVGVV